jgi:amino acid adenylation domain-containing protein
MQSCVDISVSDQIAKLGEICPYAVALSSGDQHLTYAQLNCQADQFASYLARGGVVREDTVAICLERSFDWIVAALGIMRAGAAYLPLDPAWPDARLRFAINDSNAAVLVARPATIRRLDVKVTGIDPFNDSLAIQAAYGNPVARGRAALESLAYVIYTSGSTGVPKGVEITHANLCHLIRWHHEAFAVTSQDRASHLAGLGFDAAVWEIWPHLAAGATVCLADDAARLSPELLQQWLIRERVTIAFVPTVHASSLMAMPWPATSSLRLLLTGGDALQRGPAVNLRFTVVNNYGLTECTVVSTSAVLRPESSKAGSSGAPPIGHPITGASVYLLDEEGMPVSDGNRGEIYIGGGGVGRGYRNLPDATARCFLSDPFAAKPFARMYRTGDFGVRRPNGEIEFCGRRDRQTKIRGIRIELDEIDSVLMSHRAVDFAVAITRSSAERGNELVAHVLPKKDMASPTVRELQQHLLERLPDYMVPATFVRLHEIPLSLNGKLDLKLLHEPTEQNLLEDGGARLTETDALAGCKTSANGGAGLDRMHNCCCTQAAEIRNEIDVSTPRRPMPELSRGREAATPIEEKLLIMMREILKNNTVRAKDNFFLAGGHSLLAMQLVMRVRDAFGIDMTLRQLFESPTVERLAVLVERILIEKISSMTDEEAERQLIA